MKFLTTSLFLLIIPYSYYFLFKPEIKKAGTPQTIKIGSKANTEPAVHATITPGGNGILTATGDFFAGGSISVYPQSIYDNDVINGAVGIKRKVTVKNTGSGTLSLAQITKSGTDTNQFILSGLPAFPGNINVGDSITFFVAFNPSSTGIKTATVVINSDDALTPVTTIPLRGLGVKALGSVNEPSLQSLLNLLQVEANVGDDSISTPILNTSVALQKAQLLGDEVSLQKFVKAGAGNVTITPLAVFGPIDTDTIVGMGWYESGDTTTITELFSVSNVPVSNGQTVNVNYSGVLSFDPAADTFGFYSHWPHFNDRHLYSEDNLNTFTGSAPHHVRVYPYRRKGVLIPDTYLVAFEETTARLDYNDLIFLVSNVKKVQSNAMIFIENRDGFPANDQLVFSRVQNPWSRDSINYNSNHDTVKTRIHNNGISPLIITNLTLSNDTTWQIEKLNNLPYVAGSSLPFTLISGGTVDLMLRFIATDQGSRIRVLHETLTIASNDDKYPFKIVYLNGLWQKEGEGNSEPHAQEILNVFNYKTKTGFVDMDPDEGDSTKLKGDEIKPSFFIRADAARPITVRQLAAYHGCCTTTEKIYWYNKGSATYNTVFTHLEEDGQTLLPRRGLPNFAGTGTFTPPGAFGFKVGFSDFTEASENPGNKIGIRVWKALDAAGAIIPDAYLFSSDYLGTDVTNYDYQDNTYFISNIRPESGSIFYSALAATPSAVDFGEKTLNTSDSIVLNIKSLGKLYGDGSADPVINISRLDITGENNAEFSADSALNSTLAPQQTSSVTIRFNPLSQGLKIADLLIYYNNARSPLRVPLYGIAKAADTIVVVNHRIKSGSASPITVNGKVWSADTPYAFDNLEPYTNPNISDIAATDEDSLYLVEQSSDANKRPFRYEIPIPNGKYVVRLHFAEIFWGAPGGGIGEEGVRVMGVKIENQSKLINFDIGQEVGTASAVIKNFPVTVTDGKLNINFTASVNRPSLSAVEVYSFVSGGPLAAEEFTLTGNLTENGVSLDWTNSNETGTGYFEIQRSTDNINFTSIGKVASNGSTKYNFLDSDPAGSNNFYRIKKVTLDDKSVYSKIIRIDFPASFRMRLFPNPARDKITIQFAGLPGNQMANLSLQSISGSTIRTIPLVLSNQKITVDISSLPSGTYILRLTGDNITINRKFLKK